MARGTQRQLSIIKLGIILSILNPLPTTQTAEIIPDSVDNCVLWNAARCKPAYQKRIHAGGTANLGVDGNRNQNFERRSCFHTKDDEDSWWLVDLMDEYLVHTIVITNRGGPNEYRLSDIAVDLFPLDPRNDVSFPRNTNGVLCVEWMPYFVGTKSFECLSPTYARYLKISKRSKGILHACEVEVMVSMKRGDANCQRMVSKSYDVIKNSSMASSPYVLDKAVTSTAQACVQFCTRKGDLCNGLFWKEATSDCQMLSVNPGTILEMQGTDFYVESPIQCIGDGSWKYV